MMRLSKIFMKSVMVGFCGYLFCYKGVIFVIFRFMVIRLICFKIEISYYRLKLFYFFSIF